MMRLADLVDRRVADRGAAQPGSVGADPPARGKAEPPACHRSVRHGARAEGAIGQAGAAIPGQSLETNNKELNRFLLETIVRRTNF